MQKNKTFSKFPPDANQVPKSFAMESMGDLVSALDSSPAISAGDPSAASKGSATSDAARISEVRSWLAAQFEAAGREVPAFDYTPRVVSHLHAMATLSTARSRADAIVAADLRLKASEYRAQAARIREVLDAAGLSHERLTPVALNAAQDLACVANLLNIRDTELNRCGSSVRVWVFWKIF